MKRVLAATVVLALSASVAGCSTDAPSRSDAVPADATPRATASTGSVWSPAPATVDGLSVVAQSDATGLRLHTASGDKTFLPGINLGSTTPGHQPGEVGTIEASTYRTWLAQMGDLGIRVVRVYTLHPPAFYDELDRYNRAHPAAPIYLVQGAYLPEEDYNAPGKTLYTPSIDASFTAELHDLSDAVHGDLTRASRPGRAGGTWRTDVSRWVASWIIGVEWDPTGVQQTDRVMAKVAYTPGKYFAATRDATPTEKWITRHLDAIATDEAARGTSVPIAAANWPTADPLRHTTEPIEMEDLVSVDALHMLPTKAWPGGTFASFHAYPYYPDFQRYEPGYEKTTWEGQPDRYAGYLTALKKHFAGVMPLAITEFGVPSSLGSAHAGTNGRDQGQHSEQEAMAMDASMMRMMAGLGLAAGFVFSWEDEWFKRTWNTVEHQDAERRQLWHDPLTNEQYFGIVATDPKAMADASVSSSPDSGALSKVRVWADQSWVHVELTGRDTVPSQVQVGVDTLPGPDTADYRFTLDTAAGNGLAEVRAALDPIRLDTPQRPYRPGQAAPWHPYDLITNRGYSGRPAEFAQVSKLVQGTWDTASPAYDSMSTWHVDAADRTVSLRLPWSMVGVADPSQRLALGEGDTATTVKIAGLGLDLAVDGSTDHVDLTWPEWTRVGYTQRLKAGAGKLEEAYRALAP